MANASCILIFFASLQTDLKNSGVNWVDGFLLKGAF